MTRRDTPFRRFGLALVALCLGGTACATAAERRPVATGVIYPGEIIRDDMLTDTTFPDAAASSAYASDRSMLVGKVAKRTLLPGQPIPVNSVGQPRLVTVGAMVRLVYIEDGLSISTYASALQAGAAGDLISARNTETGLVVSGIIQADGSIHVGPS